MEIFTVGLRVIFLILLSSKTCKSLKLTRCFDHGRFDHKLLCLPGTGAHITSITAFADINGLSPIGKCRGSTRTCFATVSTATVVYSNAEESCEGRIACDFLAKNENTRLKIRCLNNLDDYALISYFTMTYVCQERPDIEYRSGCSGQTLDDLTCAAGTYINVTEVYIGLSATCSPRVGDCIVRVPDAHKLMTSIKQRCDGQMICDGPKAYKFGTPCGNGDHYTVIGYVCVKPKVTVTEGPVVDAKDVGQNQTWFGQNTTIIAVTVVLATTVILLVWFLRRPQEITVIEERTTDEARQTDTLRATHQSLISAPEEVSSTTLEARTTEEESDNKDVCEPEDSETGVKRRAFDPIHTQCTEVNQ